MDRRGLTESFKTKKLAKGTCIKNLTLTILIYITGDSYTEEIESGALTCLKWQDKREVKLLSSFHSGEHITISRRTKNVQGGREDIQKPKMIDEYNQNMGGVDRNDQMILYNGYSHRYMYTLPKLYQLSISIGQRNGGKEYSTIY